MNLSPEERRHFERERAAQAYADRQYGQALWYAWGRIDSGQYQGFPLNAFAFAESVKQESLTFAREQTFHLQSIQDAWARYVERESS